MRILFLSIFLISLCFGGVEAYTSNQFLAAKKLGEQSVIIKQLSLKAYRLDETMTRKEFMKVLANKVGDQIPNECDYEFRDVKNDWGCKYIEWAMKNAFVAQDNYFRPNEAMTKAESMKLILKARKIKRVQKTSDWREDDMETAFQKGIIELKYSDYDNTATRGWIFEGLAAEEGIFVKQAQARRDASYYRIGTYRFFKDVYLYLN